MLAFAGNSLLCRIALKQTGIDAASFTGIRIVSGALALWLIVRLRAGPIDRSGSWGSALALFAYAAAFSFSYLTLTAATGALLLFGAVQVTMIGYGRWQGVRMSGRQAGGLAVALAGLVYLLLPGLSAPPLQGSVLMIGAGVAWGVYSLRAKGSGDPLRVTAGNFMRAVVPAVALGAALLPGASIDAHRVANSIATGAHASGVGYALWYSALVGLNVTRAATVQLSVPLIAALGGVVFLDEQLTVRLIVASVAILGGIAWVVTERRPA